MTNPRRPPRRWQCLKSSLLAQALLVVPSTTCVEAAVDIQMTCHPEIQHKTCQQHPYYGGHNARGLNRLPNPEYNAANEYPNDQTPSNCQAHLYRTSVLWVQSGRPEFTTCLTAVHISVFPSLVPSVVVRLSVSIACRWRVSLDVLVRELAKLAQKP